MNRTTPLLRRATTYLAAALVAVGGTTVALAPAGAAASPSTASPSKAVGALPSAAPLAVDPGAYVAVRPTRALDTRIGLGATGPVRKGGTANATVAGIGAVPSTGVDAVVLTVTVTAATHRGYVTVYPAGTTKPATSSVNFLAKQTVPNAVLVKVGVGGKVAFTNGSWGTVQIIADVAGYVRSGTSGNPGALVALPPARILDSRYSATFGGPIPPASSKTLPVAGHGGIPATDVHAAVVTLTETGATRGGYLTAYPSGGHRPLASTLNFTAGRSVANLAVVPLGPDGSIAVYSSSAQPVHAIVDVLGYVTDGAAVDTGMMSPLGPTRVLDTRSGLGGSHTVKAYGTVKLTVRGVAGVPSSRVSAVVLNLTETRSRARGYLTAYPSGTTRPTASNSNFVARQTSAHAVVVRVGRDGKVAIYNGSAGTLELVADLEGYVIDEPPAPVTSAPISVGTYGSCAVTASGGVACWGNYTSGELGGGTETDTWVPFNVPGLSGIVSVAVGRTHECALDTTGKAWCWGSNFAGQLGVGTSSYTNTTTPVAVHLPGPATSIAAGIDFTCAVVDRAAYCWGSGAYGQLGNGGTANRLMPTPVTNLSLGVESIATGDRHVCAIADGGAWCWGENVHGQLGNGTRSRSLVPVPVRGLGSGVGSVGTSDATSCAAMTSGSVRCWGAYAPASPPYGVDYTTPRAVSGIADATAITVGAGFFCARTTVGQARCWGNNNYGQTGTGATTTSVTTPAAPLGLGDQVQGIDADTDTACAATGHGVRCWGWGADARLGGGMRLDQPTTVPVVGLTTAVTATSAGDVMACALTSDQKVSCWGSKAYVGNGSASGTQYAATPVSGLTNVVGLSGGARFTCALKDDGTVWCWGEAGKDQVGATTRQYTPHQVTPLGTATAIVSGAEFTCALLQDHSVACWGDGAAGELGDGTSTGPSATPTAVAGLTDAIALTAGHQHACAIRSDHTAVCWGSDSDGQLGDGTTGSLSRSPVAVAGVSGVQSISAGTNHTCAMASGGPTCWGHSAFGEITGTGSAIYGPTVLSYLPDTTASVVAGNLETCAIDADGTLSCWGSNGHGLLGTGLVGASNATPEVVETGGAGVAQLTLGSPVACLATTTGAMCWGDRSSSSGALGDASTTSFSRVPVAPTGL